MARELILTLSHMLSSGSQAHHPRLLCQVSDVADGCGMNDLSMDPSALLAAILASLTFPGTEAVEALQGDPQ